MSEQKKKNISKKKVIIAIILIAIFMACFIPNPEEYNSMHQLNIVSPYGDKEAYHPKVLNFKEKWNGYKYWMSYTPYPQGDDAKENPCIAASNDLINWNTPNGLTNPLDTPSDTRPQLRYNSDSHIVYNNDLNRLECYWRYVNDVDNEAIIYRRCSTDGINWSKKEVALTLKTRIQNHDCVSPAILYENGIYKMWYVSKNNTVKYMTSKDGLHWDNKQIIKIKYEDKVKTWHLDVIHTEKGYEMIAVAYTKWEKHNDMNLYYTFSEDGINWRESKVIVKPMTGTTRWDNRGIYRSSFIYEDGMYYVYYSGTSQELHHGIGLMYGKDILKLKRVKTNYEDNKEVEKLKEKIIREKTF